MPESKISYTGIRRLFQFVEDKEYLKIRDGFERVIDPDIFYDGPWHEEYFDEKNQNRKESSIRIPVDSVEKLPDGDYLEHCGEPVVTNSEYKLTEWIEKKLAGTLESIKRDFSVEENTQDECMEWEKKDWPGSIRALLRAMKRILEKEEDEECKKAMLAVIKRLDWKLIDTLPDEVQENLRSSRRGNPSFKRKNIIEQEREIAAYAQELIDAEPENYRPRENAVVSNLLKIEIKDEFGFSESTSYRRLKDALERKQFFYR